MNLYTVTRFESSNCNVKHSPATLCTDAEIQALPWFQAETTHANDRGLLDLKPGESTVMSDDRPRDRGEIILHHGWRITRLPAFAMNTVYFDHVNKEHVLVTNGTDANQTLVPTEAIALRPFVVDGKVTLAWTYKHVDACNLSAIKDAEATKQTMFTAVLQRRRSARFIGRI